MPDCETNSGGEDDSGGSSWGKSGMSDIMPAPMKMLMKSPMMKMKIMALMKTVSG